MSKYADLTQTFLTAKSYSKLDKGGDLYALGEGLKNHYGEEGANYGLNIITILLEVSNGLREIAQIHPYKVPRDTLANIDEENYEKRLKRRTRAYIKRWEKLADDLLMAYGAHKPDGANPWDPYLIDRQKCRYSAPNNDLHLIIHHATGLINDIWTDWEISYNAELLDEITPIAVHSR